MILRFDFIQVYDNGVLENILHKILCKINAKGVISANKKEVSLYIKGEEKKIEDFSNEFSKLLPLSLFYTFVKADVVEDMPEQEDLKKLMLNPPFSQLELKEFLDADGKNYLNTALDADVAKGVENLSKEIDVKIKLLKEGKILRVSTREGIKSLGIVKKEFSNILKKNSYKIMPTDLSLLPRMVVASENEISALATLEKPTIDLKVNLIYKNKNILPDDFVRVKMCDSLLLYLLCRKLFESGEKFIFLCDGELASSGDLLEKRDGEAKSLDINVLENNAFVQIGQNDYNKDLKLPHFEQKAHERFTSVIYEYNLFENKNLSFFLSKKHDGFVMSYDKKNGLIELVNVQIPNSFEEIFEIIKKDENGKKLIENYKKFHKDLFDKALNLKIPKDLPNNFYTLLGFAGVLLGYGEDLKNGAENLLKHAKNFSGTKGARLDVKPGGEKFPSSINVARFIQSGLSFRLAGVEPQTLSYGYLESIAYFISDTADLLAKEFELDNVSLCGELFTYKRLLETAAKNIQPNHKIFINKAFSIE